MAEDVAPRRGRPVVLEVRYRTSLANPRPHRRLLVRLCRCRL